MAKSQKRPEMPPAKDDGHKWNRQDRALIKGDVIRIKDQNSTSPHYGQYAYGICSGSGFGCDPAKMGNAIFVENVSYDLAETMGKSATGHERWERFWGVEYLVE